MMSEILFAHFDVADLVAGDHVTIVLEIQISETCFNWKPVLRSQSECPVGKHESRASG